MKYIQYLIIPAFCLGLFSCRSSQVDLFNENRYRTEMIKFVEELRDTVKSMNPEFYIIAQNAGVLLTKNGEPDGQLNSRYLQTIDGISKENLFYGYEGDNLPTAQHRRKETIAFLNIAKNEGKTIMAVDYCSTNSKIINSYHLNRQQGYISFAAPKRELNRIPKYSSSVIQENSENIESLADARNFLYILNPSDYETEEKFVAALEQTNYDVIVLDWAFHGRPLSNSQIDLLQTKANGAKRLVIAYMSIGEAEDYRYYWQKAWEQNRPSWIKEENPNWPGNYPVRYWTDEWKEIIIRSNNSYLKRLIRAGYDGVYLDRVDSFYFFENEYYDLTSGS